MTITVQLFARARDLVGNERVSLELGGEPTVAALRAALGEAYPDLRPLVPSLHVAVNQEYATDETPVPAEAEVACFPPVSGG